MPRVDPPGKGSPVDRVRPVTPRPANLLPADAQARLIAASQIENPHARRLAVDEVTRYVKHHHPKYFQKGVQA